MKIRYLILLVLVFLSDQSFSQTDGSAETFSLFTKSTELQKSLPTGDEEIQRTNIQINQEIMQPSVVSRGDRLFIELFSEESFEATVTRVDQNVMGITSIIGQIPSKVFPGNIIITFDKDNRLFATVNLFDENRLFEVKSDPLQNEHYLVEKDKKAMKPMECGGVITIEEDDKWGRIDY